MVQPQSLIDDLKLLVCRAVNDALAGKKKLSGKEIVAHLLPSILGDIRNGDAAWAVSIYTRAYAMAKVHCLSPKKSDNI